MTRKTNRQIRNSLYKKQNGKCFWCEIPTIECDVIFKKGELIPSNKSTLDHVYHKGHPLKSNPPPNSAYVLACFSCNQKRSKLQEKTDALVIIRKDKVEYVKCDTSSAKSKFVLSGHKR